MTKWERQQLKGFDRETALSILIAAKRQALLKYIQMKLNESAELNLDKEWKHDDKRDT